VGSSAVFSAAEAIFGSWQGTVPPPVLPATRVRTTPQIRFVRDSDSQMSLQMAFLGIRRGDPQFMALRLLRRLLAGGGSSRLHLRLREQLGIIYSVEASIGAYDETGCLAIDLSTAPDTLAQAVEVTLEEILRILREPIPLEELERVRQSYIYDLEFSRDSAYEMGGRFGWGELMDVVRTIEADQQEAQGIRSEDIMEIARLVFAPANLRLVAVGPWKSGMKKLTRELVQQYSENFHSGRTAHSD